jgi:hypothetical protein
MNTARSAETKTEMRWDGFQKVSVLMRRPSIRDCLKSWGLNVAIAVGLPLATYLLVTKNFEVVGLMAGGAIGTSIAAVMHYWKGWVPDND